MHTYYPVYNLKFMCKHMVTEYVLICLYMSILAAFIGSLYYIQVVAAEQSQTSYVANC